MLNNKKYKTHAINESNKWECKIKEKKKMVKQFIAFMK